MPLSRITVRWIVKNYRLRSCGAHDIPGATALVLESVIANVIVIGVISGTSSGGRQLGFNERLAAFT
jgi:hypothetical protein